MTLTWMDIADSLLYGTLGSAIGWTVVILLHL